MLDKLTIENFSKHLNNKFQIQFETGEGEEVAQSTFEAELVEVSQLGEKPEDEEQRQSFSVIFRGPSEPVLSKQHICKISHDEMGQLDLFLVPIGPDKTGMLYEAVFT